MQFGIDIICLNRNVLEAGNKLIGPDGDVHVLRRGSLIIADKGV